jgi:hypothetical protein
MNISPNQFSIKCRTGGWCGRVAAAIALRAIGFSIGIALGYKLPEIFPLISVTL